MAVVLRGPGFRMVAFVHISNTNFSLVNNQLNLGSHGVIDLIVL